MTQAQAISSDSSGSRIFRFVGVLYGLVAYFAFFGTILYAIGFVTGLVVPKTIDTGTESSATEALIVNLLLMSLFAVQHSLMARKQFKQWWTQYVPKSVERSTYVLFASLALILLFWQWRPMPAVVWAIADPDIAVTIATLSFGGWVIVFTSTFLINHFELFGLHQVANNLVPRDAGAPLPDAAVLQIRAAPDLSRFHHCVLGGADDDGWPSAVRGGDHGLHLRRHSLGRTGSDCHVRRRLPPLQEAGVDVGALAQVGLIGHFKLNGIRRKKRYVMTHSGSSPPVFISTTPRRCCRCRTVCRS